MTRYLHSSPGPLENAFRVRFFSDCRTAYITELQGTEYEWPETLVQR